MDDAPWRMRALPHTRIQRVPCNSVLIKAPKRERPTDCTCPPSPGQALRCLRKMYRQYLNAGVWDDGHTPHLVLAQGEVQSVRIFSLALRVRTFGQGNHALLGEPAEHYLGHLLASLLGNLDQYRVFQVTTTRNRRIGCFSMLSQQGYTMRSSMHQATRTLDGDSLSFTEFS